MKQRLLIGSLSIAMSVMLSVPFVTVGGDIRYSVTDLGQINGQDSNAESINTGGQVVGYSYSLQSFLWNPSKPNATNGVLHPLETLGTGPDAAFGINDSGEIALNSGHEVFLWKPTTPNGTEGTSYRINANNAFYESVGNINNYGQVCFFSSSKAPFEFHAYLWTPTSPNGTSGSFTQLGTLGGLESVAYGINRKGQVTGNADLPGNSVSHAFIWKPTVPNGATGEMLDIGTLGGDFAMGLAINDACDVTGFSYTEGFSIQHAFLFDGAMHDLGTLGGTESEGLGINDSGELVGDSDTPDGTHAFIYTKDSGMQDLNLFIDPSAGWELDMANAVNDEGQIVGQGFFDNEYHAFLLTPVPEPGGLALAAFAALSAFVLYRLRCVRSNSSGRDRCLHFSRSPPLGP